MRQPLCYDRCGRLAAGSSAYCQECSARHVRPMPPSGEKCPTCGACFTCTSAFDKHRVGQGSGRECRDPGERGLVPTDRRGWKMWSWPDSGSRDRHRTAPRMTQTAAEGLSG